MKTMMSACGVHCSKCPAYRGATKGIAYQKKVVEAWHRIYGLNETAEHISCSGCLGPDEELFYTSRTCNARHCCKSKGLRNCAECMKKSCAKLEKTQSVWDEVPKLAGKLSSSDFNTYAKPYCGHRKRLAVVRRKYQKQSEG